MTMSLHRSRLIIAGCAIALGTGCSSDGAASTEPIIVVETLPDTTASGISAPDTASTSASDASGSAGDAAADSTSPAPTESVPEETDEEKLAKFSQCMRDNGVEAFQDPVVQPDGSVNLFADESEARDVTTDPEFNGAYEACVSLVEGAAFVSDQAASDAEDDLVKLAACLRERGIEVDDPNFDAEDPKDVFGSDLDTNDPAVDEAVSACSQEVFTETPVEQ